jgi:hypothetical protein
VCTRGDIAVSSVGVAGCASLTVAGYPEPYWFGVHWIPVKIRAGAGYRWSNRKVDVMGTSCDVGPYRAARAASVSVIGQAPPITIARGLAAAVRFEGRGAPPLVELTAPGGKRHIVANTTGAFKANDYYYVQNASDNSTEITIAKPAGGRWTVRVLDGSAPVISEAQATVTPDASAGATVTGSGTQHVLHYLLESEPDQQVTFYERGPGYEQSLGTARGGACPKPPTVPKTPAGDIPATPRLRCGTIAFTSGAGPAGTRNIVAVVTNGDEAFKETHVASYTLRLAPPLAAPAGVRILRAGDQVTVVWLGVVGARTYDVDVRLNDGESKVYVVGGGQRRLTIPEGISPADLVTVTLSGVSPEEVQGTRRTVTNPGAAGGLPPAPEIPPLTPS